MTGCRLIDRLVIVGATGDLAGHAAGVPLGSRGAVVDAIRYRQVDLAEPASVRDVVDDVASGNPDAPVAFYVAPPLPGDGAGRRSINKIRRTLTRR